MQAYLDLRMLEANLRSTISSKYGSPTTVSDNREDDSQYYGYGMPVMMKLRWVPLYDSSGKVTHPGANEGVPYSPYPGPNDRPQWSRNWGTTMPHFGGYAKWWDLPFPTIEET
jgi:hypothetical protein